MAYPFGATVKQKADELAAQGKDANLIAKIVFDQDPEGYNYGIGIVLDEQGQAWPTSRTLLKHTHKELSASLQGNYMSSSARMTALKEAVMDWQRIPAEYRDRFTLLTPSDAGTGAVQASIDMALSRYPALTGIGVEELSWPAYKAISATARTGFREYPIGWIMEDSAALPIYQAGPMNTTGKVQNAGVMAGRARAAAASGRPVLLDRAYSGFEYARLLDSASYDEIMTMSYSDQIRPFIEEGVFFWLAISPTKAFVSFALRPCGLVLVHTPDTSQNPSITSLVNTVMRARGSSFEHPTSRALARALIEDREGLEHEHQAALRRLADAERLWRALSGGSALSEQFSSDYAGLFRNIRIKPEGREALYEAHLYPVFSGNRCRLNITGIPGDEEIARRHVAVFAEYVDG